jgi:hypothetical protein
MLEFLDIFVEGPHRSKALQLLKALRTVGIVQYREKGLSNGLGLDDAIQSTRWDAGSSLKHASETLETGPRFSVTRKDMFIRQDLSKTAAAAMEDPPLQAHLAVRSPMMSMKNEWIEKFCLLEFDTFTCFQSNKNSDPEVVIRVDDPKTRIQVVESTVLAIDSRDYDRLLVDFHRQDVLHVWMSRLHAIQKKAAVAPAESATEKKQRRYREMLLKGALTCTIVSFSVT